MTKLLPAIAMAILPLSIAAAQPADEDVSTQSCAMAQGEGHHGTMGAQGSMHGDADHGSMHGDAEHGSTMHGDSAMHGGAQHGSMHGDADHGSMHGGNMQAMHDQCAAREDTPQDN